jgi:hypothetical protein
MNDRSESDRSTTDGIEREVVAPLRLDPQARARRLEALDQEHPELARARRARLASPGDGYGALGALVFSAWLFALPAASRAAAQPAALAKSFATAVVRLNEDHAKAPGKTKEADLAAKLPRPARGALEKLLELKPSPDLADALARAAEAALDLDLVADFDRVAAALAAVSPERARKLGVAVSRPRFLVRGQDGVERDYAVKFADLLDQILGAYDDVFGFDEWSKVPGKKLRVRVHLVEKATRPPHFAPQFPYHSQIDFPVTDGRTFRSPTQDGRFLLYGLCHELGHVIAMWGDLQNEEDRHQWAHYTGVAVVDHLARHQQPCAFLAASRDRNWRSLELERKRVGAKTATLDDADGVLALFVALHDRIGPRQLGAAIDLLDHRDQRARIQRVRYYTFRELRAALLELVQDRRDRAWLERLLPAR